MRKAKDLIGKAIVHQTTGEHLATVRDLIFEQNAHSIAAILVDSGGWFRDARVITWDHVVTISDVVMVTGDHPVEKASDSPDLAEQLKADVRLTGLPIMSDSGERIGTIGDLYINDAGEVVGYEVKQGFLSSNKFLFADHVQSIGKDAMIADTLELTSIKAAQRDIDQHKSEAGAPVAHETTAQSYEAPDETRVEAYPEPQPGVLSPLETDAPQVLPDGTSTHEADTIVATRSADDTAIVLPEDTRSDVSSQPVETDPADTAHERQV